MPSNDTTFTLAQLRTTILERTDMVNSNYATSSELTTYINQSYAELYDILIGAFDNDYFVANPYTFSTTANTQLYALPADFYKLLGVDLQVTSDPNSWITLRRFEFQERNNYRVPNQLALAGLSNLRYKLSGSNIWLTPVPSSSQNLQLWYIPKITYLVNDTDTLDGVSGWEDYVITDVCIKLLAKEESDCSVFMAQKAALLQRIQAMAENRDAGQPPRVTDTQSIEDWGYFGYGGNWEW